MPLRPVRRKGSRLWHTDGAVAGQRIRQCLGTGDRARAEELCAQLEARLWKRHSYGEAAVRTFEEAALSYQLAGGERRFLAPLIRHFRGRVLGAIQPGEVRAAAQALYPGRAPRTLNRQGIVPARAVINHGAALGWCPAIRVPMFETRKPKRRTVERGWIDAFMAQAEKDGLAHAAAAMLFMFQTAARIGETVRILPEDVDLERRVVTLARTKEEDWEERAITRELVIRIANLRPRPRPIGAAGDAPLFGYASRFTLGQAIRRICARAGIDYVPSHQAGRHSAASIAFRERFSVPDVMKAYGWKTARLLLETYAHAEDAGRAIADRLDTMASQPPLAEGRKPPRRKHNS